jgi:hypothetical protein
MAAGLGNILYWIGCGLAILLLLAGVVSVVKFSDDLGLVYAILLFVMYVVTAAIIWGVGRMLRYVLAGT